MNDNTNQKVVYFKLRLLDNCKLSGVQKAALQMPLSVWVFGLPSKILIKQLSNE